jgi:hypothetical protein
MKNVTIDRRKSAPPRTSLEKSAPSPPTERYTHKVIMNVCGKRFELTSNVKVREITKGPAIVIEMPRRGANEK